MTSGAQANPGTRAAAGASRVLFLSCLLVADLEQRLDALRCDDHWLAHLNT